MSTSPTSEDVDSGVRQFNALDDQEAQKLLGSCLDVPRWVTAVLAGRPYPTADALLDRADVLARTLTADEVGAALARHPRIGEPAGVGHDVEFSAREQAAVDSSDSEVFEALRLGNAEYERRFGRVFLIRAAGRTSTDVLSELRRRMRNDDTVEMAEVVQQLGQIAGIRLGEMMGR